MESITEQKKKKLPKLTCDLHQLTSSVRPNSTATVDLNVNSLGGEKRRERERERERSREIDPKKKEKKEKKKRKRER